MGQDDSLDTSTNIFGWLTATPYLNPVSHYSSKAIRPVDNFMLDSFQQSGNGSSLPCVT
jgi:hypothetical protein